ncbi:hypothetical protein GBA65_16435 [Rubrobacter marinus]|uniref:Uncharacterized protein n=1 Tax=Rubrobacter marinus TaxID=2653852 RepID=A0A6G8Q081_9ACTN|nr:hypothetical protein [Rubrobacter marinus]QIN79855.1 hypothetical protein GBA65_16435 [Rubrobacter marinus]
MEEARFKLVAVTFFGQKEVARFSTLETAEQRASEMNEHAERNPRGYAQYVVRPLESRGNERPSTADHPPGG